MRTAAADNQARVLRYLLGFHPLQWGPSIREIGEATELAPSTVLRHLRELEAEGLIDRGPGERQVRAKVEA